MRRAVVSLALVDPSTKQWWLFEATPDIKQQLQRFNQETKGRYPYLPAGIFITHAHIGHYTGLMELGKEVMNTKEIKVYVLPGMKTFLEQNGPWSQLVKLGNIRLQELQPSVPFTIAAGNVTAVAVPHRDEFSETAGFKIATSQKKYLFIPDIDKWSRWDRSVKEEVKKVDVAFLDATFYSATELSNRNIAEVPHPLVTETIEQFNKEPDSVKHKICFIHFNHTNPLLWDESARRQLQGKGYRVAELMKRY